MENVIPTVPPSRQPKLLDQVRHTVRTKHYSKRTEKTYVGWVYRFVVFHSPREIEFDLARLAASSLFEKIKNSITFQLSHGVKKRHPKDMGADEIRAFLNHLAVQGVRYDMLTMIIISVLLKLLEIRNVQTMLSHPLNGNVAASTQNQALNACPDWLG